VVVTKTTTSTGNAIFAKLRLTMPPSSFAVIGRPHSGQRPDEK
jgi:hypothetical protein